MTFSGVYNKAIDTPATAPSVERFLDAVRDVYVVSSRPRSLAAYGRGDTYVYFLQCEGFVKIGFGVNPTARADQFQIGNPFPVRVIGVLPGGYAEERAVHGALAQLRVGGEWFRLTPRLMRIIKEHSAEYLPSPLDVPVQSRRKRRARNTRMWGR